jgi:hypothetical protein
MKMLKEIDRRIAAEETGKKFKKMHKKEKKEKKRDKKHKHKKEKLQNSDFASLPIEYFDFTSDHGLIPALPSNNSYNRNLVISFGHSGVQYILNQIFLKQDESLILQKMRNKIMKNHTMNDG